MRNLRSHRLSTAGAVISFMGLIFFFENALSSEPVFEDAVIVEFESMSYIYSPSPFRIKRAKKLGIEIEPNIEPSVPLTGYLTRPEGDGPHPAMVLLHTCAGISEHEASWAETLVGWGYVVLTVDSLTPRGVNYICDGRPGSMAPWTGPWMPMVARDSCQIILSLIRIVLLEWECHMEE
ncbi:MAG: dienelactone hydrolase family protein [bacterium]